MNMRTLWRRQLSPLPTCAEGCAGDLPIVKSDNCAPKVLESEIRRIFVAKRTTTPFNDWEDTAEWQDRLSDTDTASEDSIRTLWVIGDKPAPGQTTKEISNRRKIVITKQHVVNFTIDDAQEEIHDFIRGLECGGYFKIWYETHGGLLFGGNLGITVFLKADMVLARGVDEHMVYNGTAEWQAKFTEERIDSPIFYFGSAETAEYDFVQAFEASATPAAENGVELVAVATDTEQKFAYIIIDPTVGTDLVMTIKEGATLKLTVTFKSDYLGTVFKYITTAGNARYGNFTNGEVVVVA